jgi:hypothetical protein
VFKRGEGERKSSLIPPLRKGDADTRKKKVEKEKPSPHQPRAIRRCPLPQGERKLGGKIASLITGKMRGNGFSRSSFQRKDSLRMTGDDGGLIMG